MRVVPSPESAREEPKPLRIDGITTGVRVLTDGGWERFYPAATSYLYTDAWLLVEDADDTLAAIERGRVIAVELGHATKGE